MDQNVNDVAATLSPPACIKTTDYNQTARQSANRWRKAKKGSVHLLSNYHIWRNSCLVKYSLSRKF